MDNNKINDTYAAADDVSYSVRKLISVLSDVNMKRKDQSELDEAVRAARIACDKFLKSIE